jgi:cysteinyl-tRNA synthetase
MTLKIYNTLSGKKEVFKPLVKGRVGMYVCGPTVYDSCHIGHARSVVVFDMIFRYLKACGFEVTYVRNFTDVDDKIINRANELGISPSELAEKYIREFYDDMDALNVERATIEPKATEHIDQIVVLIEKLVAEGAAYQVDGDVYFSVNSFNAYGRLSGRKPEDMIAGARIEVDQRKKNPLDFALWKSAKPGEPCWKSPWGKGRPGWHIECSAMSSEYLGETLDIHGGGKDLIFPHHENEIAQSESASGKPFVRFWIHNGFVNINQEKMSKSLGNFLMIKDILKEYHPEAVRLFLLSNHYRSPIDFTDRSLKEAESGLDKIYALLERIEKETVPDRENEADAGEPGKGDIWARFAEAMDNDFNSAQALGTIFDSVKKLNRIINNKDISPENMRVIKAGYADLLRAGGILGILTEPPDVYFAGKKSSGIEKASIDPDLIDKMIMERSAARKEKDWARADRIRQELLDMNIVIEDGTEGTVWKVG